MAVAIRLMRIGKKAQPFYRIIAIDKRKKRNGSYIENIGTYNPLTEPAEIKVNDERLSYWKTQGAEVSEGLMKILKYKTKLTRQGSAKKTAKKATS